MLDKLKNSKLRAGILKPFLINTNPNYITAVSLFAAILAGYFFWQNKLLFGAIFVLLNGFLDILDGETAKKFNRATKLGDFLDHTIDRLADVIILLGLTFNPNIPDWLGFLTIIAVLLVSYLGTQAQAVTGKRMLSAILGRADRLVIISLAAITTLFYSQALYYGILIILVLSVISFVQRFLQTSKQL